MPIRSGHLWHVVLLRMPVALLHCQVIEMTKNIHFITNISLEDQLTINPYFSDVWLTCVDRFIKVAVVFISFFVQNPAWADVIGFSLSQLKSYGRHQLHPI
jgi:hypothetical protein